MRLNNIFLSITTLIVVHSYGYAQKMPPSLQESQREPVIYTGGLVPDSSLYDGGLPHVLGVQHYQVLRANRTHAPESAGGQGWTYNHQPYLAYWNGKFYLQYLSGEYSEHTPPTRVLLTTSASGKDWTKPEVIFPVYDLPEIKTAEGHLPAGTKAVMHQRMGFYAAPNGRLLALGFYSYTFSPRFSPNAGQGLGRVVREIKADGSYGPVYFIRYNRHNGFNEQTTPHFPFYKTSKDGAFLTACDSLLANKLMTLQWWEEDRGKDGFYTIDPGAAPGAEAFSQTVTTSAGAGKAFSFFHRPDGVVVGMWKNQWSAMSADEGRTWTPMTKNKTFRSVGAKVWGQRLDDDRYAIVRDQTAGHKNRYPMVVMAGEDGHAFDRMYALRDDNPLTRYQGLHKGPGPQYFRGIEEGNGNPPGNELWVVYSVNKEDIWISRVDVPISGEETAAVNESFSSVKAIQDLHRWNLHLTQWAPLRITAEGSTPYLELKDEDPYDYAKVERLFPKSKLVEISFRVKGFTVRQGRALEIEVQDGRSRRPLRLRIDDAWIMFDQLQEEPDPVPFKAGAWRSIRLVVDAEKGWYDVYDGGKLVQEKIVLAEKVTDVERIVFRTGPYRGYTDALAATQGPPGTTGTTVEDLPGADEKLPAIIYGITDLVIKKLR